MSWSGCTGFGCCRARDREQPVEDLERGLRVARLDGVRELVDRHGTLVAEVRRDIVGSELGARLVGGRQDVDERDRAPRVVGEVRRDERCGLRREQDSGAVRRLLQHVGGLLAPGRPLVGAHGLQLLRERDRDRPAPRDEHERGRVERRVEVRHERIHVAGRERTGFAHDDHARSGHERRADGRVEHRADHRLACL